MKISSCAETDKITTLHICRCRIFSSIKKCENNPEKFCMLDTNKNKACWFSILTRFPHHSSQNKIDFYRDSNFMEKTF